MKKNLYQYAGRCLAILTFCTITACENVIEETETSTEQEMTVPTPMRLNFQTKVETFDAAEGTRTDADTWEWKDGDIVYLQFMQGSTRIPGYAFYTKGNNTWNAFPNSALTNNTEGTCAISYFEGASTTDKTSVTLTWDNAIYTDPSAYYTVQNNEITLEGLLTPKTGRVKFVGDGTIDVRGFTFYNKYDAGTHTFSTENLYTWTLENSDSHEGYYYLCFNNEGTRHVQLINSTDGILNQFVKDFPSSVLQPGKSGYITIPTTADPKNWTLLENNESRTKTFTIEGNGMTVSFNMRYVEHGQFLMGYCDTYNEENYHWVKLTKDYYMGETEVTQALWYAVMGQRPIEGEDYQWLSYYGLGNDYPAYYISYEDCQMFLAKLNALTGEKFRFPTEAEWEFAAKGGNYSMEYIYAGSNHIDKVMWRDGKTHDVKKQSNELGLFNMSGNVAEWCADWYDYYSSGLQTDPTGPTTEKSYRGRVVRGRSDYYYIIRSNGSVTQHDSSFDHFHFGLRLALSADESSSQQASNVDVEIYGEDDSWNSKKIEKD